MIFLTLAQARRRCNKATDDTSDDQLIQDLMTFAESYAAWFCRRTFEEEEIAAEYPRGTGTADLLLDKFPILEIDEINLDETMRFEESTVLSEWDETAGTGDYIVDADEGRITLINGYVWPEGPRTVKAVYTAGYATADDVPASIKEGCLQLVALMFQNRQIAPNVRSETVGSYEIQYQTFADSNTAVRSVVTRYFKPFQVSVGAV